MTTDERVILERIEGQLVSHATTLDKHIDDQGAWEKKVTSQLAGIDKHIRGNGSPGINLRLDRIERREAGRTKLSWIAITAASATLVGWLKAHFKP